MTPMARLTMESATWFMFPKSSFYPMTLELTLLDIAFPADKIFLS
jgi:hypothetical protein